MEKEKLEKTNKKFNEQDKLVVNQTQTVASVNVQHENILQTLPSLRLEENNIASELQKNSINLNNQEKEIERANAAVEQIQIRIGQIKNDISKRAVFT